MCSDLEGKIFLTQLLHFLNSFFLCLSWCLAVFIYVFGWYIRVCGWPVLQRRGSNVSSFSAGKNYVWVSLTIINKCLYIKILLNDCTQLQIHVIVVLSKIYLFLFLLMILKSRTTSACFPFFFLHRSGNGALTSKYSARQVCFHYIFVTRNTMNFHPFSLCIIAPPCIIDDWHYWTFQLRLINFGVLVFEKGGLGTSKRIKVIVRRLKVNFDKLKH